MDRREFLKRSAMVAAGAGMAMSLSRMAVAQAERPAEAKPAEGKPAEAPKWKLRKLGKTGIMVTPVSFGAMNTQDATLIRYAVDKGINYIDTARSYSGGKNEGYVAQAVKDVRDKVTVATKCKPGSKEEVIASAETSLKELQVERIDILQLHGLNTREQVLNQGSIAGLEELKKAGKVRFTGVSTHSKQADVINAVVEGKFFDIVLAGYRVGMEQQLDEPIAKAVEAGVGIVAMKTQQAARRRRGDTDTTPPPAHLSLLKGALKNPNISCAIPGMTAREQVDDALQAMEVAFDWEDRKRVAEHLAAVDRSLCRMCGGCAGACPRGVAVNEVERCLMYAEGYRDLGLARAEYGLLPAAVSAAPCSDCGKCVVRCAYRLKTREHMLRAHTLLA